MVTGFYSLSSGTSSENYIDGVFRRSINERRDPLALTPAHLGLALRCSGWKQCPHDVRAFLSRKPVPRKGVLSPFPCNSVDRLPFPGGKHATSLNW